ncbi:MAG: tRNA 2-thiouridine(34) synthase MnmA [Flavobacteriaceae bacterium]|nr:tRNA 2-thiouridine(34) synthase MnmA [Flavobacteriaceae bacterium]
MKKTKVVVALSGGVDSSVAAYLLRDQGYDLIGLFMKNWDDKSVTISEECPWLDDSNDAMLVAEKLNIPFQVVDLSKDYKEKIIDYMFDEYSKGNTPNPDILCNREIKFDIFMDIALSLGADYVATGHYSRIKTKYDSKNKIKYELHSGIDKTKDQSYFLCQLNQEHLNKIIFPIGDLTKTEVRKIAKKNNLVTAEKKDSQGLCFVGKVSLPDFLQQKLKKKTGNVIEIQSDSKLFDKEINFKDENERLISLTNEIDYSISDGKIIGRHNGAHYYTVGQRKGIAIGGYKEPLFVISTNTKTNEIIVGEGKNHPGLNKKALKVKFSEINWVNNNYNFENIKDLKLRARIRYRQKLQKISISKYHDFLFVEFEDFQTAITKGQFLAIYDNSQLIASGVIC